jgi:hypothetical protein
MSFLFPLQHRPETEPETPVNTRGGFLFGPKFESLNA